MAEADKKSKPSDNEPKKDQQGGKDAKKEKKKTEELSEEDLKLKEDLELLVTRVADSDEGVQKLALETLRVEIRASTSSMTSVPKPLKFLRPHFDTLKENYETLLKGENKKLLADILSVLAMCLPTKVDDVDSALCLKFKLNGNVSDIGTWGHEYVRHLSGEIGTVYELRKSTAEKGAAEMNDLMELIAEIVPINIKHNAEHEACDLLIAVESVHDIPKYVDSTNFARTCTYLLQCANYLPEPEDKFIFQAVLDIHKKLNNYTDAIRVAIKMGNMDEVKALYKAIPDPVVKKQVCYILGRQNLFALADEGFEEDEEYQKITSNSFLNEQFLALAKDLDVLEPKTPDEIYKSHLTESKFSFGASQVDSARQNLADTFVNAFVNVGFGTDKLMTVKDSKWIFKNKEHGMLSAAASLGLIHLWNDEGFIEVDKYFHSTQDYVKAGALLACGVLNAGVRNEMDPTFAILSEYLGADQASALRIPAILGLGLTYAGSAREDILSILVGIVEEGDSVDIEVAAMAALALGMIFVGTTNAEVAQCLALNLLEREAGADSAYNRFFCLGLGLVYLGAQEKAEVPLETLKAMSSPYKDYAIVTLETCAYACSGNVLKVQELLHLIAEPLDKDSKSQHQAVAVLGIALIAMGEDLGAEMALRTFDHILQYGEPVIKQAVPIALGLISVSNPRLQVVDTLSKLSHDAIANVSQGAIFALGLCGAGTNNSRIAGLLRQLSAYYAKEPNHLFMVRLAQGLLHLGKGTIGLSPFHSHGLLVSQVALAGLLTTLHTCLDLQTLVLGKSHFLLYSLVSAMYPRLLMTVNEDLEPLPVPVRVGQAVDTIGQAGRPKTITGFQTHTTPVLIASGERAEIATEDYIPVTNTLENIIILKPNPNAPKPVFTKKK